MTSSSATEAKKKVVSSWQLETVSAKTHTSKYKNLLVSKAAISNYNFTHTQTFCKKVRPLIT